MNIYRFRNKSKRFTYGLVAGLIVVFVLTIFIFVTIISQKTVKEYIPKVTYHGPNPKLKIYTVPQDKDVRILGVEKINPPSGLLVSDVISEVIDNLDQVAPSIATSIESNTVYEISTNEKTVAVPDALDKYGIAAGGGLIYLGQSDLDVYFTLLKALGVKWVRWDIDWSMVQYESSKKYDWSGVDRVAQTAESYGIESLAIITYTPEWARSSQCQGDWQCAPADPADFGHFAEEVALRYKDTISYFEIWNEPNYQFFWYPRPNISAYSEILKEAYTGIKNANPNAFVLSGGLTSSADDPDGNISPITFLETLYEIGSNIYFDAVSFHPYTYPALPSYIADWNGWLDNNRIHQILVANGDINKKVWITEYGAPTGGPGRLFKANQVDDFVYGEDYMSESAQAEMISEALDFYSQNTEWLGPIFFYSLIDIGTSTSTPENFFGFMRHNNSKKPVYNIYKNYILSN